MFWTVHSRGSIPLYNALERVSQDVQQKIIVLAIAPAKVIPKILCFDSFHYASTRDFVPQLGLATRLCLGDREDTPFQQVKGRIDIDQELKDFNELIWLDPHPNAPLHEHAFDSQTFELTIKRHITDYVKKNRTQ